MTAIDDLVQGPGERHMVYGGTRRGKSSGMDWNMRHIQRTRPKCDQLVADTKPRFRAETVAYGPGNRLRKSTLKAGTYDSWASGPVLPNSVLVPWQSNHPLRGMWNHEKRPGEIAIMQGETAREWVLMLHLMHHFVNRRLKDQERLVVVDEGLDFYQRNTLGIDSKNDVILRTARAGGERNIGLLFGAHRPHGVPPLLNLLSSRITLFHLRFERDMAYLHDIGVPEEEESPVGDYVFKQFKVAPGGTIDGPVTARFKYPDSYLKQLAAT